METSPREKRQKPNLSCAECRRTKAKCDRVFPCGECVRRGLGRLCPNHVSSTAPPKSQTIAMLTQRVQELEQKLKSLGQEVESEPAPAVLAGEDLPTRPYDMSATLGRLTLGPTAASSKKYIGSEAAPFYLGGDETDDEGEESAALPWRRSRRVRLGKLGDIPGAVMDEVREMMMPRRLAEEVWAAFWELTSWRVQPMTPKFFHERILETVYSPAGPNPHQLAVLFGLTASVLVLNPSSPLKERLSKKPYLDTAWQCLVCGNMFTTITLESLITLALVGLCLLNADDRDSPDANFAVFGLGVRLAIIAGYHRDPALLRLDMPVEEMDARRRIWHELLASDRLHSMPGLLPNSISYTHYDTKLPSDSDPNGHFVWKWTIGVQISRVVDYWTSTRIPPYSVLQQIDAGIRRLFFALPERLRSPSLPLTAFSLERPGAPPVPPPSRQASAPLGDTNDILVRQQIRLAMHFCMLFFYLHRPCFIHSLVGDLAMQLSLETMIETCGHVVTLTDAVMALDWTLSRWFSFAADLFSVLQCLAVLVIKDSGNTEGYMAQLRRGVEILEWTNQLHPSAKNRTLLQRARDLLRNAEDSQPAWQDWLAQVTEPEWEASLDAFLSGLWQTDTGL